MKTRFKILSLGILIFLICGAPTISFDALFPPEIILPGDIKTLVVIDRSQPDKKTLNIIEGGLTGEGFSQDRQASQICLDGLCSRINNSRQYSAVRSTDHYINKGTGTGLDLPLPLDWKEIEEICRKFNADAVISLDFFDSDFLIDYAQVKTGFRWYNPNVKSILDEVRYTRKISLGHPVNSVPSAIGRILDKNDAIRDAAYESGVQYGQRISPVWLRVTRTYYKRGKGNDNLKMGARMMEVNNWDAAIESFNRAMDDRHRKVKGRTAHNLAVVYEILGEYQLAREWAQAAWGKYRNKDSKDYSMILGQRINEVSMLNK